MSTKDQHRLRNKYPHLFEDDVHVFGEGDASAWGQGVATGVSAIAEIVQKQQDGQAAAKKAQKDKEAGLKKENDIKDAQLAADNARRIANGKANEAQLADLKAQAEKEPYGPLHVAAQNARNAAAQADSDARKLEMKVATLQGPTAADQMAALQQMQRQAGGSQGAPRWLWWLLGGVGAAGAGLLGYKLIKGKGKKS